MKKSIFFTLAILAVFMLSGCADAVHVNQCLPAVEPSGFWHGCWHGMIAVIAFIFKLVDNNVAIYDVNNNGCWYDFGYIGGLGIIIKFVRILIVGIEKS